MTTLKTQQSACKSTESPKQRPKTVYTTSGKKLNFTNPRLIGNEEIAEIKCFTVDKDAIFKDCRNCPHCKKKREAMQKVKSMRQESSGTKLSTFSARLNQGSSLRNLRLVKGGKFFSEMPKEKTLHRFQTLFSQGIKLLQT